MKKKSSESRRVISLLGKYPGRTIHRIGATLGGVWLTGGLLAYTWPMPDQVDLKSTSNNIIKVQNVELPNKNITIIIIGLNSSQYRTMETKSSIDENSSTDSLILININRDKQLKVLQIPTELKLFIGKDNPNNFISLSDCYKKGKAALCTQMISKLIGLELTTHDRYIIIHKNMIEKIITSLGGIQINLMSKSFKNSHEKISNFNLTSNKERISGNKAASIFFPGNQIENQILIRKNRQNILKGLLNEIKSKKNIKKISLLSKKFHNNITTNLSYLELLSLTKVATSKERSIAIKQVNYKYISNKDSYRLLNIRKNKFNW